MGRRPQLDWWLLDHAAHYRVHNLVKHLNSVYKDNPALWALDSSPAGFEWLNADDNAGNTFSYLRFGAEDRDSGAGGGRAGQLRRHGPGDLRVGVPRPGQWKVILDTSGYDEFSTPSQADVVLEAQEQPWDNQPYSVEVRVAALSTVWLAPAGQSAPATQIAAAEEQED